MLPVPLNVGTLKLVYFPSSSCSCNLVAPFRNFHPQKLFVKSHECRSSARVKTYAYSLRSRRAHVVTSKKYHELTGSGRYVLGTGTRTMSRTSRETSYSNRLLVDPAYCHQSALRSLASDAEIDTALQPESNLLRYST